MNTEHVPIPKWADLVRAARMLKVLGHPARMQILHFIRDEEETVTAIQRHAGLTQAMTSQHLKILHGVNLVLRRRQGTSILYRATEDPGKEMLHCLHSCEGIWRNMPIERPDY